MARNGQLLEVEALSEVGIFGTFLRRGSKVLLNKEAGHLVRTKVQPCELSLGAAKSRIRVFLSARE
jgi:hypothetical protein